MKVERMLTKQSLMAHIRTRAQDSGGAGATGGKPEGGCPRPEADKGMDPNHIICGAQLSAFTLLCFHVCQPISGTYVCIAISVFALVVYTGRCFP